MKKRAFTLAEVLITLGIIGVVSAVTLPTLMSNTQYKQLGVKLQKFYTNLSNAARAYVTANQDFTIVSNGAKGNGGAPDYASSTDSDSYINFINETFLFKSTYTSSGKTTNNEFSSGSYGFYKMKSFDSENASYGILKDGTSIAVDYLYGKIDKNKYPEEKYGSIAFSIVFSPNVKGLPDHSQNLYEFIVTSKGMVIPYDEPCIQAINNNDWVVTKSMFNNDGVCHISSYGRS